MWAKLQDKLDAAGAEIEWEVGLPLPEEQQDAMFYKDANSYIAKVKLGEFAIEIWCDGETRVKNRVTGSTLTYGSDLRADGIDTDKKLADGFESGDLVHDMNSWFDLYVDGEHVDAVTHEIEDAVDAAISFLEEERDNAKIIENLL